MPSPAWAIRSMAMHPTLPLFAATGLDRKCHVFELESRTKLATTFLKQRQSALLFPDTAVSVLSAAPVSSSVSVSLAAPVSSSESVSVVVDPDASVVPAMVLPVE